MAGTRHKSSVRTKIKDCTQRSNLTWYFASRQQLLLPTGQGELWVGGGEEGPYCPALPSLARGRSLPPVREGEMTWPAGTSINRCILVVKFITTD